MLEQVIAELRSAFPDREIVSDIAMIGPINCDASRIGQLLSNLLANALNHGAADQPVRVKAARTDRLLELSVANAGVPIPRATIERLFQPFFRGSGRSRHQGLGLGLYIASEIARAHDGTIEVESTSEETRFTLRIPAN